MNTTETLLTGLTVLALTAVGVKEFVDTVLPPFAANMNLVRANDIDQNELYAELIPGDQRTRELTPLPEIVRNMDSSLRAAAEAELEREGE